MTVAPPRALSSAVVDPTPALEALGEKLDEITALLTALAANLDVVEVTGRVGTLTTAQPHTGQTTSNTTAVRLTTGVPEQTTNGVLVQALKANTSQVYVGPAGVTTKTGFELQPGQSISFTCRVYDLAVVGSNSTDGVCWSVV